LIDNESGKLVYDQTYSPSPLIYLNGQSVAMANLKYMPLIVVTTLAIILVTPFVLAFFVVPLVIYRTLLSAVYQYKNPGSLGIFSAHSSLWYLLTPAAEAGEGRRGWSCSNANQLLVVLTLKLEGATLDIGAFQSLVSTQVVFAREGDSTEGLLLYPELQQYPDLWSGYLFW
jgi:hypothetical protein